MKIKILLTLSICINIILAFSFDYLISNPRIIKQSPEEPKYQVSEVLLSDVNKYRASQKLPLIEYDQAWCDQAKIRLEQITKNFSHEGNQEIISRKKYTTLGENLAEDFLTNADVMNGWLSSPSHKELLDDPEYKFGCVKTNGNQTVLLASDTE